MNFISAAPIDKQEFSEYDKVNFIKRLSAVGSSEGLTENSESGQNPERYRHCMRGGRARGESQSLGVNLEKAVHELMMRESGDLLKRNAYVLPSMKQ